MIMKTVFFNNKGESNEDKMLKVLNVCLGLHITRQQVM